MFEPGSWFWRWLADQPAYIAVGSGMCFVLIIAPAMLTAVAFATTHAEGLVESLVNRFIVRLADPRSKGAVWSSVGTDKASAK